MLCGGCLGECWVWRGDWGIAKWNVVVKVVVVCCSLIFHLTPPTREKLGRCHRPTVGLVEAGIEDAVKDPTIPDHTRQIVPFGVTGHVGGASLIFHACNNMRDDPRYEREESFRLACCYDNAKQSSNERSHYS